MDKIKLRPLQKVGAIVAALKSGQIDSWAIVPHIAKALAKGGKIRIVGWVRDYAPDYQVTTVFTSAKSAAEATVRLIHKYVYTSRPFEKAAPSIRNGAMRLNKGARLNLSSIKAQLDWFKAAGLVKGDIGIDKLVDGSYVETY